MDLLDAGLGGENRCSEYPQGKDMVVVERKIQNDHVLSWSTSRQRLLQQCAGGFV